MIVDEKKMSQEEVERFSEMLREIRDFALPKSDLKELASAQLDKGVVIVRERWDGRIGVVVYGEGNQVEVSVCFGERLELANNKLIYECLIDSRYLKFLHGSKRDINWRGRVFMGNTSLMARIANGVRGGRAFRGR